MTRQRGAMMVSALLALVAACSGGGDADNTLAPIASTLAPNEPVVVVGDEATGDGGDIALSEGEASDAAGDTADTPVAATVPLDIDVVDDILGTTVPPGSPTTTTTTTAATSSNTAAPTTATTTTAAPATSTTKPSGPTTTSGGTPVPSVTTTTSAPSSGSTTTSTTGPTTSTATTTQSTKPPDPVNGPPDNAVVLTELATSSVSTPTSEPQPLKVLRYAPEGPVGSAPFVAVTFNQPMIALAGLPLSATPQPPITIDPAPPGRWHWAGTQTVRFEVIPDEENPVRRMPAATEYTVTVSKDIASATGSTLDADVTWSFSTPPPTIESVANAADSADLGNAASPQIATKPVFVARFDQTVDPAAVVSVMSLTAGDSSVPLRLATETEIDSNQAAEAATDAAPYKSVAVTPASELPTDTEIQLTIGPNIPSAEGPATTPEARTFVAHTHGPLSIASAGCVESRCDAGTALKLEFNNPLDTSDVTNADLVDMLTIQPALPGLSINIMDSIVVFEGATAANTTYTLSADARLTDVFGQSLGTTQSRTVTVGDALPRFRGPTSPMVVVDPESDSPKLAVETVNYHKLVVSVWAVSMKDYADFLALGETVGDADEVEAPEAWQRFDEREIEIGGGANEVVTTEIDLDDDFAQAGSQLVVYVRPVIAPGADSADATDPPLLAWVQQTSLAIDAIADEANLLIWTTDLRTGKPVGGVPVDLIGDGRVATTDDEGIAVLKLDDVPLSGLFANDGNRIVFLPAPGGRGWAKSDGDTTGRWSVVTDRDVYRPGDTVQLTGWLRGLTPDGKELLSTPPADTEILISARDSLGAQIGAGSATTNELGGFSIELELAGNPSLGEASLSLQRGPDETSVPFQIENYRAPEFEVTVGPRDTGPFVASTPLELVATGLYYSGGPVANADTDWSVTSRTTTFRPPNQDAYVFGRDVAVYGTESCIDCGSDTTTKSFEGTTDGGGSNYLKIASEANSGLPVAITARAAITDLNRHTWGGNADVLVHPGLDYVGLKTNELFVAADDSLGVDAIVTGIDGVPVAGRDVDVAVNIVRSSYVNGEWNETLEKVDGCAFASVVPNDQQSAQMRCEFQLSEPGQYRIVAEVTDEDGGVSRTELDRWVAGSLARASSQANVDTAQIIPDRPSYQPGDTARLLISSPWAPARGVVAISRFGITETIPFEATDGSAIVEVPITERSVPNAIGWVTMAGTAPRLDRFGNPVPGATRPAVASAQINLPVPATNRTLSVTTAAQTPTIRPASDASVSVHVDDAGGTPVSDAQVAVIVVDEAVLALTDYQIADPTDDFYAPYFGVLSGTSVREYVQLLRSDAVDLGASGSSDTTVPTLESPGVSNAPADAEATTETGSTGDDPTYVADGTNTAGVRTRTNLAPIAVFSPDNTTDDNGDVTVDFRVPDNLTNYRIVALAVATDQQFGFGESTVTAGQPLDVRPSAPRFVRLGDAFSFPVVLRNQTDESQTIQVAADPTGLEPTGPVGQQVTIPAKSRVEVRFDMVASTTGLATIRFVARGASDTDLTDSAVATLDVYPPATTETVAAYNTLDAIDGQAAAVQPVRPPSRSLSGYGGLNVQVNPTILSTLVDAVTYLRDDTFTSSSSNASRLIGIAALHDVLESLDAPGVGDPTLLAARGRRSMNDLISSQRADGGWSAWPRQDRSDPWSSVLAAHSLAIAIDAGWLSEDSPTIENTVAYLTTIDDHIPAYVEGSTRWTIKAQAIKVLDEIGNETADRMARELYDDHGDELEVDALAMIWPSISDPAIAEEIERRLTGAATETAAGVTFATDYGDDGFLIAESDQRTDAVVLDAFLAVRPDAKLVPKAMRALLSNRSEGRWANDQANAFATLAVRHYYDRFESTDVEMSAQVWLGNSSILEQAFSGGERSITSVTTPFPQVRADTTEGVAKVTVSNTGSGRLYFRVGMTYAIDGTTPPTDQGFVVERIYEPVTNPKDVVRNQDGSWTIKAGALVRVRLTMVADSERTNVALTDPFPAGLEPVKPSLAVSHRLVDPTKTPRWRGRGWFDHQSLTPTRAEAIATLLPGGVFEYAYVVQAVTPGEFGVPPARAEQLYQPETFGRSASDQVTIVAGS